MLWKACYPVQKNILFEDEHIIVVYKPAGIATQTARIGQQDMVSELKNYLSSRTGAGSVPYLGIVHRLDQPVSGLLVFAKTREAAADLGRQITGGQMQKFYHALVSGVPGKESATLTDYLFKDGKTNRSLIVGADFPGGRRAVLTYRLVRTLIALEDDLGYRQYRAYVRALHAKRSADLPKEREISLVEILLLTGRHHQIRVQMAGAGLPLLGDGRYGVPASRELSQKVHCRSVALCASKLTFYHPVTRQELSFRHLPEDDIFQPFFAEGI